MCHVSLVIYTCTHVYVALGQHRNLGNLSLSLSLFAPSPPPPPPPSPCLSLSPPKVPRATGFWSYVPPSSQSHHRHGPLCLCRAYLVHTCTPAQRTRTLMHAVAERKKKLRDYTLMLRGIIVPLGRAAFGRTLVCVGDCVRMSATAPSQY
jgi:hypothetical protein